ncbi:hypothetical protein HZH68_010569 [Vespula germanica]|uniref:Uncharacterized protein n=1 Tax=Vespula germanica TaxID=30212 RepID=A0A834N213_VESGE|nr:hypothetical protein HZH68_010569 [Vespula germanica]
MRDSAIQKNNKSLYTRFSFIRITGAYLYPSVVVRVRHEVEVLEKPEIPVVFERIRKAVEDVAVENARFADSILSCLAKTTRPRRRGRHNGVKVRRRVEKREVEEEEEEKGVSNKTMTSRQSKDPVQKCHSDPGAGSTPGTSYSPTKRISRKQVPGISSSANTRKCVLTLDGYSYVIDSVRHQSDELNRINSKPRNHVPLVSRC